MKRRLGNEVSLGDAKELASRMLILEALLLAHDGGTDEESSAEGDDDQFDRDHRVVMRICGGQLERIHESETEEGIAAVFLE